jgi:hypothetical protein
MDSRTISSGFNVGTIPQAKILPEVVPRKEFGVYTPKSGQPLAHGLPAGGFQSRWQNHRAETFQPSMNSLQNGNSNNISTNPISYHEH